MRYAQGHKEQTRARLLREAAAVIRSDGPERLSVATLMKRAGLTHGGFYVHFASKDELVAEAVAYMFEARHEAFLQAVGLADPRAALDAMVDYYLSVEHRDAPEGGCPIPILAGEHHRLPEAARARFVLGLERLTHAIETLLDRAGIQALPNTVESAVSEMIGAIALARVHADAGRAEAMLSAAKRSVRAKLQLA